MQRTILAAALALALTAGHAALAAEACRDTGAADAQQVAVDPQDAELAAGLKASLMLALTPASFPADNVRDNRNACRRGAITANGAQVETFGDDTDTPPRWAGGAGARIVYLAVAPDPSEALAWARNGGGGALQLQKPPYYVLAATDGRRRKLIYQFWVGVPADEALTAAMRDVLEGRLAPLARFDADTGETTFVTQ